MRLFSSSKVATHRAVLICFIIGVSWTVCSDLLLAYFVKDSARVVALQAVFGGLFVIFTAGLLYRKILGSLAERDRSVSLLHAALESTADAIVVTDLSGRITRFNQNFARLFRVSSEMLGAEGGDSELLSIAAAQIIESDRMLSKVGSTESDDSDVLEMKDGRVVESYSRPQRIGAQVVGWVWSFRDVTERRKAEEQRQKSKEELTERVQERTRELTEANAFLASLIENIPNMIFVKDAAELKFVRFNRAGELLLGYSREELVGKNDYDFFPRSEAEYFTSKDRAVLENGEVLDIPEEHIHTRFKGDRILHTKKLPVYDPQGRPLYLLGISEDITEKKQAEEDRFRLAQEQKARVEAEKSIQLRDDFLSIASHELRTPLTPIRMQLQLAKKYLQTRLPSDPASAVLAKGLDDAEQQFDRFLKLVENLLDVSRITAGLLSVEREEIDLSGLALEVAARFSPELKKKACEFTVSVQPGIKGCLDRVRIEQVLINLLSNAMKYGAGKPVEISLSSQVGPTRERVATLVVRDHGIGISKQHQGKVFGRFERFASPKHFGGLGLGLYIVRSIVLAHGGEVTVEGDVGMGAKFTVLLPLDACINGFARS